MATTPVIPTKVVFRKWRGKNGNGIIALFPEDREHNGFCSSFEHVGQHSSADYQGVISRTIPATPEEYAGLKQELESDPYHYILKPVKRTTRR